VNARKNRYIAREFGQEGTSDRGTRITLAVDERRDRADITCRGRARSPAS
jgi:hypothetical protein